MVNPSLDVAKSILGTIADLCLDRQPLWIHVMYVLGPTGCWQRSEAFSSADDPLAGDSIHYTVSPKL